MNKKLQLRGPDCKSLVTFSHELGANARSTFNGKVFFYGNSILLLFIMSIYIYILYPFLLSSFWSFYVTLRCL